MDEKKVKSVSLRNIKKASEYIFEYSKLYLLINIVVVFIQGSLPAIYIIVMQKMINLLQSNSNKFSEIMLFLAIYIALNILNITLISSYDYYKSQFIQRFDKHINLIMLNKAAELTLKHYEDAETYNIINRAQGQSGVSLITYISNILGVLQQIITIGSTVVILINFRWWMVGTVLIVPIIRCLLTLFIDKKWYFLRISRTTEERKSWYINFLMMTGTAFKEIKVLGISKYLINKYENIAEMIITQDIKMEKCNTFFAIILNFIEWIILGSTYVYIVFLGFTRIILIGDVTAYIDCIGKIKDSAQGIFVGIGDVIEQSLYIELLFQYMEIPGNKEEGTIQIQSIDKIELKDVSFRYKNGKYALRKIDMVLYRGSKVALIGENGSGKSTLIKLIMGLYEDYEGDIFVNDINLKKLNIKEYQKKIGCVFQDYVRYEMSVRENIAFGDIKKIDDDVEIWNQIRTVQLDKIIKETDGLDLVLGNWFGDQEISIGEWQRIAVARALIKDADVYFFDEPDASLDVLKQRELIDIYKKMTKDKTFIYVSHKINHVHLLVNHIVVLATGEIVERGNHEELLGNKSYYYNLFTKCDLSQEK